MKIAIFTVIKDEQEYLQDWLEYHLREGIDIFVFEDVFSSSHKSITDRYEHVFLHSVKELYSDEEIPQLIENRRNKVPPQTDFINRGLKYMHSLEEYDWCWLIDCDEYITSTEPIGDVLRRFKEHDAVLVYWKNFGCSGNIYKPKYDKPIYEIYTEQCGYEKFSDEKYYKITKFCVNLNRWKPSMKYAIHNALVNWVKADGTYKRTEIVFEPLYLRHYITKSVEEFLWKLNVRGMFHSNHRKIQSLWEMCPDIKEEVFKDKYFLNKYNIYE